MPDEERQVKARLDVEKTGDVDAFKQTAEEITDVGESASKVDRDIGALRERLSRLTGEARKLANESKAAGDSIGGLGGKLTKIGGQLLATGAAFTAGWRAGEQFRRVLNDISNGGFDRGLQSIIGKVVTLADKERDAAQEATVLTNNLRILKANGIDPTGLSADQVAEKVGNLAAAQRAAKESAADAATAYQEWLAQLDLSKEKLDQATQAMAQNISQFAEQNQQLSQGQLGEIFGQQIEEVLDNYERLGSEAPPQLQAIADAWGIVSSRSKESIAALNEDLDGFRDAMEGVNLQVLKIRDFKAFQQVGEGVKNLVDDIQAAGAAIPPDVAAIAAELGVLTTSSATVTAATEKQTAETLALMAAYSRTAGKIGEAATGVKEGAEKFREAGEIAGEGAEGVEAQAAAAEEAGAKLSTAATSTDTFKTSQEQAETAVAGVKGGLDELKASAEGIETTFQTAASGISSAFQGLAGFADPVLSGLDAIISKAAAAKAALESVASVDGGGEGAAVEGE